jgi:serine/threonine protein kinase
MGADASEVKLLVGPERRVRALADVVCASIGELYKVGAELGVGRFSTVHAGEALGTGRRFALKVVENGSLNEDENLVALETEVQILRLLEHPYVVSLKEVVMTIDKTYIVMELLNGGELFEKIAEVGCYPEREAALVFARLIAAVEFMHARQVVHRDLKPENILFGATRAAKRGGGADVARRLPRVG